METEELNNTIQETTEQAPQVVEQETPVTEEPQQEDIQAKNIREMRLIKEKAEKERDEAYALLQKMKTQNEPKPASEPEPEPDYDFGIADDDLVEGKHLGKIAKEMRDLKKELKSYQQATTSATVETRLKQKYNDFDNVVSKENVEALVRDYPELGNTLRSNTDLYSQAVTAYTMIKQMGIYREDKFAGDRAKAEENAGKPRPLASMSPQQGDGALSKANAFAGGLTKELKEQLIKEMNDARSRM